MTSPLSAAQKDFSCRSDVCSVLSPPFDLCAFEPKTEKHHEYSDKHTCVDKLYIEPCDGDVQTKQHVQV